MKSAMTGWPLPRSQLPRGGTFEIPKKTQTIKYAGEFLKLKWKNIRTCFSREMRRRAGSKRGAAATRKSPYVFFNQLQFLAETVINNRRQVILANSEAEENENDDPVEELSPPPQKRMKKIPKDKTHNELKRVLKKSVNIKEEFEPIQYVDSHKMFLFSLIDDFKKIPENRLLNTKMEIINAIQRARSFPIEAEYSADHRNHQHIRRTNCFNAYQEHLDYPKQCRSNALATGRLPKAPESIFKFF
ncbi:uncharacterized protein LOC143919142 isoform X2 [Arctopsyche grandis]|uniref:uncharacterized protein LOC143919142 isoform X2 n=1 Tax=Arctopsyche grandis TaxID=121162 RepID=UPI00406DA2A4